MKAASRHERKYRVSATLGDGSLRIPQGRMCPKEIYNVLMQEFAGFYKTSVDVRYCQRRQMRMKQIKFSVCLFGLMHQRYGSSSRTRNTSLRSTILAVRRTVYPEVAGSCPVGVAELQKDRHPGKIHILPGPGSAPGSAIAGRHGARSGS